MCTGTAVAVVDESACYTHVHFFVLILFQPLHRNSQANVGRDNALRVFSSIGKRRCCM